MRTRRTFLIILTLAPMCAAQQEKRPTFEIQGKVARPGKYEIKDALRVFEAINGAGGFVDFENVFRRHQELGFTFVVERRSQLESAFTDLLRLLFAPTQPYRGVEQQQSGRSQPQARELARPVEMPMIRRDRPDDRY